MSRFLVPLAAFLVLAAILAIGIKHSPEKAIIASPLLGKPAPQFELPSLADPGRLVRSADLKGHWYLFNVWGTWCGECRAEHEMLLEVKRAGVVPLIGLDWKDEDGRAQAWLAQLGDPYQVVAIDRVGRTAIDWGVYGAPETFLVNPQGLVVEKLYGPMSPKLWQDKFLPHLNIAAGGKS